MLQIFICYNFRRLESISIHTGFFVSKFHLFLRIVFGRVSQFQQLKLSSYSSIFRLRCLLMPLEVSLSIIRSSIIYFWLHWQESKCLFFSAVYQSLHIKLSSWDSIVLNYWLNEPQQVFEFLWGLVYLPATWR